MNEVILAVGEVPLVGGGPSDRGVAAGGRRGRGAAAAQAAESSNRVARTGRRHSARVPRDAVAVGDPDGAQQSRSARRPYVAVLPGPTGLDVPEPVPVLDRDDGDAAGASGRVSPRRRCP